MSTFKQTFILAFWSLLTTASFGQNFHFTTEVQSKFIDITGLFGVAEPASVTQFSVKKNAFGLELQHSFSLEHFGSTIQTVAIPSYTFPLSADKKWLLKTKVDVAYILSSGGAFVRPGVLLIYKPNERNMLTYGNWLFFDARSRSEHPQKLEGLTWYLGYTHQSEMKSWHLSQESRMLFVNVKEVLKVGAAFQKLTFTHKATQIFAGATGVYTYYHSKTGAQFFWNLFIGKNL